MKIKISYDTAQGQKIPISFLSGKLSKNILLFLLCFSLLAIPALTSACGGSSDVKILNPEDEEDNFFDEEDEEDSLDNDEGEDDEAMAEAEASASREREELEREREKEEKERLAEESRKKEEEESKRKEEEESKKLEEEAKAQEESEAEALAKEEEEKKKKEKAKKEEEKKKQEKTETNKQQAQPQPVQTQPAYVTAPPAQITDEGTAVLADPAVNTDILPTGDENTGETVTIYDQYGNATTVSLYGGDSTSSSGTAPNYYTPGFSGNTGNTGNTGSTDTSGGSAGEQDLAGAISQSAAEGSASADTGTAAAVIISYINAERAGRGLVPLTNDAVMQEIANVRAPYVAQSYQNSGDATGHNHGNVFCLTWIGNNYGVNCGQAENTGFFTQGTESAQEVYMDYFNSPSHAANMFNPNLSRVGVALFNSSDGRTYVVMVFGKN